MREKENEAVEENHLIEEGEEARIDSQIKDQSHKVIKRIIENLQDLKKETKVIKEKIIEMIEIKNLLDLKKNLEIKKTVLIKVLEIKRRDFQVEIILKINRLLLPYDFAHPIDLL